VLSSIQQRLVERTRFAAPSASATFVAKTKLYSTTGTTASSRQPSSCLLSVVPQHQARTGGGRGIAVALGGAPNVSCWAGQGRCPCCWLHEEIVHPVCRLLPDHQAVAA